MIADPRAFIVANTRLSPTPLCPEIKLHLADDAMELWTLTEAELGAIGLAPPFWAFAWAGGQALARYLLDHPETVRGKQVLDVACGSGLVAIAALRAGALSATAADIDPLAAAACALNAAANSVPLTALTQDPIGTAPDAELILVGDLFYDRDLAGPLLAWLKHCAEGGAAVLVGDPRRSYFPAHAFTPLAEYEAPVSRALEDCEIKTAWVWALAPAGRDDARASG